MNQQTSHCNTLWVETQNSKDQSFLKILSEFLIINFWLLGHGNRLARIQDGKDRGLYVDVDFMKHT